ncbi:MAG: hypothetical protein Q8M58_15195 [Anaerolineales bacterium]|nr:hypothetical protein [Anaerolineales bacterium]
MAEDIPLAEASSPVPASKTAERACSYPLQRGRDGTSAVSVAPTGGWEVSTGDMVVSVQARMMRKGMAAKVVYGFALADSSHFGTIGYIPIIFFIVLLLKNYRNREDSECTVIASGFFAKQSHGLRGDCFVAKNAPRNDNLFGYGG